MTSQVSLCDTQRRGAIHVMRWMRGAPSPGRLDLQKLERQGNPFPEPLEGVWPCPHLDFGLVAYRTMRV